MKIINFAILFFLFTCSSADKPVQYYGAKNLPQIEIISGKAAMIRTYYCDVIVENVRKEEWDILRNYSFFRGGGDDYPLEAAFHVIVSNTWDRPVKVESVSLSWQGGGAEAEYFKSVKDENFFSDRYNINLRNLWKSRRILSDKRLLRTIDFYDDTIAYRFDFIAPGDRVSNFYLFNFVPPGVDNFRLSVTIKYLNFKKVIDFDMNRFDYRKKEETYDIFY